MRLPRLIGVAILSALAFSCSDSTAPPTRVTALYVLESIGGQPLPATYSPNQFATVTVFWGTLNLDAAGNASMAERRRRESGTLQQERTNTWIKDYEITGENISIGPTCGQDVLAADVLTTDCYPKRVGQIAGSTLTLSGEVDEPYSLTYVYRLAASN